MTLPWESPTSRRRSTRPQRSGECSITAATSIAVPRFRPLRFLRYGDSARAGCRRESAITPVVRLLTTFGETWRGALPRDRVGTLLRAINANPVTPTPTRCASSRAPSAPHAGHDPAAVRRHSAQARTLSSPQGKKPRRRAPRGARRRTRRLRSPGGGARRGSRWRSAACRTCREGSTREIPQRVMTRGRRRREGRAQQRDRHRQRRRAGDAPATPPPRSTRGRAGACRRTPPARERQAAHEVGERRIAAVPTSRRRPTTARCG